MTAWEGFTDRELQRLKKGAEPPLALASKEGNALQSGLMQNSARKGPQALSNPSKMRSNMVLSSPTESSNLPSEAFICQPAASSPPDTDDGSTHASETATDRNGASANSPSVRPSSLPQPAEAPPSPGQCTKGEDLTPTEQLREDQNEVDLTDEPATTLDTLQKKQKEIEEENQKKKAMLQQVLAERYKRTTAESQTLAAVKKELEKIDTILSNDVLILRDKIEEVNRTFESSRKRFESAEKEYVAAKLELHRAAEAKELLAEHLCSIIQQNEMRKANKLAELMTKLNLGETAPDGVVSPTGSEEANACDMKFFQRTPTPAIYRSQLPKPQSPSAAAPPETKSSSLSPTAEPPPQRSPVSDAPAPSATSTADSMTAEEGEHRPQQPATEGGAESSDVNNGDRSAGD